MGNCYGSQSTVYCLYCQLSTEIYTTPEKGIEKDTQHILRGFDVFVYVCVCEGEGGDTKMERQESARHM